MKGIVYFMFLGQTTYAGKWSSKLEGVFIKNASNVNIELKKMIENGVVINQYQDKSKRGSPYFRTASFKPFNLLLKGVKSDISSEELDRIENYIRGIGDAYLFFPEYLKLTYKKRRYNLKKLRWSLIAGSYLNFILGLIIFNNPEEKFYTKIFSEVLNETLPRYDFKSSDFKPMAEAIKAVSEGLYKTYDEDLYRYDVLLLAELANRVLMGRTYVAIQQGRIAREKLIDRLYE